MTEEERSAFADLISKVRFHYPEPLAFTKKDSASRREIVRRITVAAYRFNLLAITVFGGRPGRERQSGLVEQVIAPAFQCPRGREPYPHPFQKAAVMVRGIVGGHPFEDANKRTGFLVAFYYLEQVEYRAPDTLSLDAVIDLCLRVSAGELREIAGIANGLAELWGAEIRF